MPNKRHHGFKSNKLSNNIGGNDSKCWSTLGQGSSPYRRIGGQNKQEAPLLLSWNYPTYYCVPFCPAQDSKCD